MASNPIPDTKIMCHRTGFTRSCREIVVEGQCRLWTQIMGHNPNTGEQMNQWSCADELLPLLMIENSQQQRQTAAAVESFRNEMVRSNDRLIEVSADKMLVATYPPRRNVD
jgi:hypothetical protein